MPTDKELAARDAQRDLGAELLESVRQMKADQAARRTQVTPTLAAQARLQMGMSQTEFAALLDVSKRTLQEWEQGRRMPTGAAQTLLRVAVQHPEALRELKPV
ncbi:helix-turn-helix domain-containing protein [Chromobacterium haemolyticum]|uniref:Helix-turn-helix domain-containing protein n=1 Tax=Chromobacterium fluminis TaxID=3044269 RepID=A0ABX0LB10_9NEIS|nr:helix-turn-helix domain-containing protein [Chromobacterium haemolyticum]NHR06801.1 helix-turn-helix domain-containing protein [Chromobacterium haemolyticum]